MDSENNAQVVLTFGQLKLVQAQLTAALARAEKAEKERDGLRQALGTAHARAGRYEALYAKAWAECEEWRDVCGVCYSGEYGLYGWFAIDNHGNIVKGMDAADAHDAARKEAGL